MGQRVTQNAKSNTNGQYPPRLVYTGAQGILFQGDCLALMDQMVSNSIDLVFAHPPYWNLINYSEEHGQSKGDLSTQPTLEEFQDNIKKVFLEVKRILKPGRHFCVLIGESFLKGGEVVPLDYYLTKIGYEVGFDFITKNIKYTRLATSRMNFINTMKYRSLRSNFFICIHDYILIFSKPERG